MAPRSTATVVQRAGNGEGVGHQSKSTYYLNSAPAWWLRIVLGSLAGFVAGNLWNRLVGLGWKLARLRKGSWRKLLPYNRVVEGVAERIARELRFGRWLEVFGPPRLGKTAGVIWGVVRWIFENNIQGYTVIVVAINRRIAVNIYKYLVGAWNALFEKAREELYITREDLRKRLRIRLHLGGEHSCLQGRRKHYIEHCLACPLYRKHSREWRRLPATPFMDPWMLKMAGYCPFIAAFSKNFYYNSIIVTTLSSLPFLLANVKRNNIRKVVIVFDEYLEALQRTRPRIKMVDTKKALKGVNSEEVKRLIGEWNRYVRLLDLTLTSIHERRIVEWLKRNPGNPLEIMTYMYTYMRDNLRKEEKLLEILEKMKSVVERLEEVANRLNTREKLVVKRLARKLRSSLGVWVTFIGWRTGKHVDKLLLKWSSDSIIGPPGGRITRLIDDLVENNVMVAVITTSVLSSRITGVTESIPPHKSLEHIPIRVTKYKRVITFNLVNLNPMKYQGRIAAVNTGLIEFFMERLEKIKGSDVVIVNKTIFKHLVQALGNRVELAGDTERGVYDYAIVRKDNGGTILLTYAHGRISMGIDPPLGGADRVWVVYGVRRPPEEYVKISLSNLAQRIPRLSDAVAGVRLFGRVRQGEAGGNGYIVLEEDKIWVYTGWDYRYDIHILVQVLGRWFLLPLHVVHINHKYFQGLARTPFYSLEPMSGINYDAPTLYVSEDGEEIYDPREVVGRAEEPEIDPSKRIRHILGSERSIYNSLRYIRKQAKYGNTPDPSWTAKKVALLLDYLRLADNPKHFRKLQGEYWDKPLPEFLERLRNYLGIPEHVWKQVVENLKSWYIRMSREIATYERLRLGRLLSRHPYP